MDFGKAFSFVMDDQDWMKKVGIGGLITLVPILQLAATGYSLEVTRRVINSDPHPLPEWDDLGGKLVKGLLVAVIGVGYMVPVLLFVCCMYAAQIAIAGGMSGSSSSTDAAGTAVVAVSGCFSCLILLYSLFAALVLPAAIGRYAATGQLGAAFRFGEIIQLVQKNLGLYLMVLLVEIAAGFVAGLGIAACAIGVYFTAFYASLVVGHATGQAYSEASTKIGLV